jgi:hypothetical protein
MAGIAPAGTATAAVANPPVQLLTSTYEAYSHWFFVWQMSAAIEVLIVAGLFFLFRPYLPFIISKIWTHLPVVGVMNRVRNIAPFGGFTLRNGMYRRDWGDNIMYYVKKYLGSYNFFGVPFDIVHIDRGFVQDPVMNKYIISLQTMGYKNYHSIDDAINFNNISPDGEEYIDDDGNVRNTTVEIVSAMGYDSYENAKKIINPSGLTTTTMLYAPKYSNIPLDSLLGYGKDIGPGSIAAQVDDTFEFRKPPIEEKEWYKLMPIIIFLIAVGISGAMILSMVH